MDVGVFLAEIGVFNAELNEFLARTLGEDGYAGVEVRVTPIRTEIIIRATRTSLWFKMFKGQKMLDDEI